MVRQHFFNDTPLLLWDFDVYAMCLKERALHSSTDIENAFSEIVAGRFLFGVRAKWPMFIHYAGGQKCYKSIYRAIVIKWTVYLCVCVAWVCTVYAYVPLNERQQVGGQVADGRRETHVTSANPYVTEK